MRGVGGSGGVMELGRGLGRCEGVEGVEEFMIGGTLYQRF